MKIMIFFWGLSLGLIIGFASGMEKDRTSLLHKGLDFSDDHQQVVCFLQKKYDLHLDFFNDLCKNKFKGLLAVLLCQWFKTEDTDDKKATNIGLSFKLLLNIFQHVLVYYGNDLMYSSDPIVSPQGLHFCYDGGYLCSLLKSKYNFSEGQIKSLIMSNFSLDNLVLLSQWYHYMACTNKVQVPFEVLLKIFGDLSNNDLKNNKFIYLTQKSGEELRNFNILFQGRCIVRPRGRSLNLDFSPCNKQIQAKQLPIMIAWVMKKLHEHKIIPNNNFYTLKRVKYRSATDCSLKFFRYEPEHTLLICQIPVFSLLVRYTHGLRSRYNTDHILIEERMVNGDHQIIAYESKNRLIIKKIRLSVLTSEETKYTNEHSFALARLSLVTFYNGCVVLYDSKTGKYPCIPLSNNIKCVYNARPYVYNDPSITGAINDSRLHLFDRLRDKKYTKPEYQQNKHSKGDEIRVIQSQRGETQFWESNVTQFKDAIIKNGTKVACVIL